MVFYEVTPRHSFEANLFHSLYENILRRSASDAEIVDQLEKVERLGLAECLAIWFCNPEVISNLRDRNSFPLIPPTEQQIDTLSKLPKLCFMHIPKTAGTRFKEQIVYNLGIDWLNLNSPIQATHRSSLSSWPLLTGHVGVTDIPESHSILSFFRESRSRLLSLYSFAQTRDLPTLEDELYSLKGFKLRDFLEHMWGDPLLQQPFYWPLPRYFSSQANFTSVDYPLLTRVALARWTHDLKLESQIFRQWSGLDINPNFTKASNVTDAYKIPAAFLQLEQKDLAALEHFSSLEDSILDCLIELRRLEPITPELKDSLYRETLSRFVLL